MCCVGSEWSVLHPSWLRSRKKWREAKVRYGREKVDCAVNDAYSSSTVVTDASAGSRVRPRRGRGEKKTKTAADKE